MLLLSIHLEKNAKKEPIQFPKYISTNIAHQLYKNLSLLEAPNTIQKHHNKKIGNNMKVINQIQSPFTHLYILRE